MHGNEIGLLLFGGKNMPWAPGVFKKLSNEECCDFLISYMKNCFNSECLVSAYRDVLHYIVGSMMITEDFRIISKKARQVLEKKKITKLNTSKSYKKKYNLILEHTIPVNCVTDYLMNLKPTDISKQKMLKLIDKVRGISLITTEEDSLLNTKYDGELKSNLPEDCSIEKMLENNSSIDFGIRYKKVGIEY